MTKPAPGSFHDQATTLRQLKMLVAALVLSNIGLGLLSFYLFRSLDRSYSELIDRNVPALGDLQALTATSAEALRGTGHVLFNADPGRQIALLQRARAALDLDRKQRREFLGRNAVSAAPGLRDELQAAGEGFWRAALDVLGAVEATKASEASRLREDQLRPAFDRYLKVINLAADRIEEQSLAESRELTNATGTRSAVLVGVASWPLIVLGILLALTAIFVVVLMVLFRGREMSDMP